MTNEKSAEEKLEMFRIEIAVDVLHAFIIFIAVQWSGAVEKAVKGLMVWDHHVPTEIATVI